MQQIDDATVADLIAVQDQIIRQISVAPKGPVQGSLGIAACGGFDGGAKIVQDLTSKLSQPLPSGSCPAQTLRIWQRGVRLR